MLVNLKQILKYGEDGGYAVPAFNVYNMETVMGVISACEEKRSPVIMQFYSRLASTGFVDYLAPVILQAAKNSTVPVCMHLDHGAGIVPVTNSVRNGATGIMVDYSKLSLEENIQNTKKIVDVLNIIDVGVEGELGFIGKAADGVPTDYTTVEDAKHYVESTGVTALAIAVGTAHGRYKQAPVLAIDRIKEIKENINAYLVLHGGSGVPDDQIKMAIKAGIRKINFATDLCYAFNDELFIQDKNKIAIDLIMQSPIQKVKEFAISKIELLGSNNRV